MLPQLGLLWFPWSLCLWAAAVQRECLWSQKESGKIILHCPSLWYLTPLLDLAQSTSVTWGKLFKCSWASWIRYREVNYLKREIVNNNSLCPYVWWTQWSFSFYFLFFTILSSWAACPFRAETVCAQGLAGWHSTKTWHRGFWIYCCTAAWD